MNTCTFHVGPKNICTKNIQELAQDTKNSRTFTLPTTITKTLKQRQEHNTTWEIRTGVITQKKRIKTKWHLDKKKNNISNTTNNTRTPTRPTNNKNTPTTEHFHEQQIKKNMCTSNTIHGNTYTKNKETRCMTFTANTHTMTIHKHVNTADTKVLL